MTSPDSDSFDILDHTTCHAGQKMFVGNSTDPSISTTAGQCWSTVKAMESSEHTRLLSQSSAQDQYRHTLPDSLGRDDAQPQLVSAYGTKSTDEYLCFLLVAVPIGIVLGFVQCPPTVVFLLNLLALVPLTVVINLAAENLSLQLGPTVGGLCRAVFGNAGDILVGILALAYGDVRLVQSCVLGSIISKQLLVTGCCFFLGGTHHHEQLFNPTMASTRSSMMTMASASFVITTMIYGTASDPAESRSIVLTVSRGAAIVLLVLYVVYLIFELRTHSHLFDAPDRQPCDHEEAGEMARSRPSTVLTAAVIIVASAALVICIRHLILTLPAFVTATHLSRPFVGMILLPLFGNATKFTTAVSSAWRNRMGLAVAVAIGSALQTAMFVTPTLVLLTWIWRAPSHPMTLYFGVFETVAVSLSTFVVNLLIQDGKSNFLEGALCLAMYIIMALAIFVFPGDNTFPALFAGHS